ncbi:9098_t:CDS:2 [Gigaspora rosea]|nr:9098_t:CDS:2 [Gigaspora rosea]
MEDGNIEDFFESKSFKSFMEVALPEFKVPSDDKIRLLLDVRTRWNSTYLAWKRLLELKNAIFYLITILKISSEKDDKGDTDYLDRINLIDSEWR